MIGNLLLVKCFSLLIMWVECWCIGWLDKLFVLFVYCWFCIVVCLSVVFVVIILLILLLINDLLICVICILLRFGVILISIGICLLCFVVKLSCLFFKFCSKLLSVLLYCKLWRFGVFGEEIFIVMYDVCLNILCI